MLFDPLPGACELKPCPSARDCISDAGIHSGFPTFHLADGTSSATQVSQEGLRKPSDLRLKLQAEAVLPVEPVAGLVSECFLFYVVVYAWPERPPMGSCQVSLACHVRFSDDLDENAPHLAEKPGVRVDLLKVSDKQVWDLESLGTSGSKIHVADFTSELKARAGLLSLEPGDLKGAPLRLRHEASKGLLLFNAASSGSVGVCSCVRKHMKQTVVFSSHSIKCNFLTRVDCTSLPLGPPRRVLPRFAAGCSLWACLQRLTRT